MKNRCENKGKIDNLTVEVSVCLTVSDEMADRCLALLEWWQNDHNEQKLMATINTDGSLHLYRELKHDPPTGD